MKEEMQRYEAMCKEHFSTHKATIVTENDRYFILDWRREDDSSDWYINFIVDKKRGAFIVSGDLGNSIAVWYNPTTPENIRSYIKSIGYYIEKIQCSSNLYKFDNDDIISGIKEHISDSDVKDWIDCSTDYDYYIEDIDDFWSLVDDLVIDGIYNFESDFHPSEELIKIIADFDPDYWEWLYDCGRRIDDRVHIWSIAFRMAMQQLRR